MARIDVLPSIEIIRGFKGILDFYVWRGLPCVRAWPKYRPAKQTAASLATALTFGAIVKAYALLANQVLLAYRENALDQPRTARDIMVTGIYGNLHEASMSDFLDAIIIIRDSVVALTDLLNALDSISTDEFDVNVEDSVLPDGASTLAEQQTQTAALVKIDDLQDALESKALDRLLVRGMDQLHSFAGPLTSLKTGAISDAAGYYDSHTPPAGQIWIVTTIASTDADNPTTEHLFLIRSAGNSYHQSYDTAAFAAARQGFHHGLLWLAPGDLIRVYFAGALAGDSCWVRLTGHIMTKET